MKAKIGNTRFDLTGGKGSIVTLAARLLAGRTKSTTTGLVQKLDTGKYGEPTRLSIGLDFLYNKTPPVTRAAIDIAKGKDRAGNKPTIGSTAFSLATPISIQNFVKNFYGPDKDGSAAAVVGSLVDFVGIGSNTYDPFSQMTKPKTPEEIADMSRSQRRKYGRDKDKPGFVRMVEGMSLDEALDVYAKADAEKRASILGSIRMKINTTMRRKDMAPKRRAELLKKIDEFRRSMGGENK